MKNNSIGISLPAEKEVRGYTIKRMPIGQFLKAVQLLQEIPETLLKALFPDAGAGEVLETLKTLTAETLQALFLRAIVVLPEQAVQIFAELSGIPVVKLLEDTAIGLDGFCELLDAWLEVNGIENFIKAAGALVGKVRNLTTKTGSKG